RLAVPAPGRGPDDRDRDRHPGPLRGRRRPALARPGGVRLLGTPGRTVVRLMQTTDRWFRTRPDSLDLGRPRLLARLLIDLADLDDHIDFYQRLLGTAADLRMPIPDFGGLE